MNLRSSIESDLFSNMDLILSLCSSTLKLKKLSFKSGNTIFSLPSILNMFLFVLELPNIFNNNPSHLVIVIVLSFILLTLLALLIINSKSIDLAKLSKSPNITLASSSLYENKGSSPEILLPSFTRSSILKLVPVGSKLFCGLL